MPPSFLYYDLERLFDEVFNAPRSMSGKLECRSHSLDSSRIWRPRMEMYEDLKNNLVTATFELPGIKKQDVQIDLHDGQLVVSGESKTTSKKDENGYTVHERQYGKFSRVLQLPRGVKDNEVKASMDNGLLSITFPRTAAGVAPKKITISSHL